MKLIRFAGGLLIGALVGGSLMLLFAPTSGPQARAAAQDWLKSIWREGQEAAEATRLELMAQLEEFRGAER